MIPQQLIQSLQNIPGFNEESFCKVHNSKEAITSVRTNPAKTFKSPIIAQGTPILWCNYGFYLKERPFFTHDPLLHCGAYYVQEASSMFLWQVLQQHCNDSTQKTVLDLCAAPGGKSTLLASFFTEGLLVSNEVIKQRANILIENITKWGSNNVVVTNNDAAHFKNLESFFDVIVIDAPCSGSGLFRKDEKAIDEWSEDNVNLCSQRQQRILSDIADCLNQNGLLIYSTCSYSKAENEDILDWLMNNYELESLQMNLQEDWGIVETISNNQAFGYRFYPDKVKGEGFFIAAFRNRKETSSKKKHKEATLEKPSKQELAIIEKNIFSNPNSFYFKHNDSIRTFPALWQKQLQILANSLYIKKAGIEIGAVKGKDLIPSHELAMSNLSLQNVTYFNLNKTQALQYLSKKEVIIDTHFEGWALLKYEDLALGWVKLLKNRMNNYYPMEWRILNTNFEDEKS